MVDRNELVIDDAKGILQEAGFIPLMFRVIVIMGSSYLPVHKAFQYYSKLSISFSYSSLCFKFYFC